ncbi:hypothetical protein D3C76_1417480 [compost metagenome]
MQPEVSAEHAADGQNEHNNHKRRQQRNGNGEGHLSFGSPVNPGRFVIFRINSDNTGKIDESGETDGLPEVEDNQDKRPWC